MKVHKLTSYILNCQNQCYRFHYVAGVKTDTAARLLASLHHWCALSVANCGGCSVWRCRDSVKFVSRTGVTFPTAPSVEATIDGRWTKAGVRATRGKVVTQMN